MKKKRYKFKIEYTDGTIMYAKGEGFGPSQALHNIINTLQYQQMTKGLTIDSVTPEEEEDIVPISFNSCILQKSQDEGWWVLTHKETSTVIKFQEKKWNETQKITSLEKEPTDPLLAATIMREAGEWLSTFRSDLAQEEIPIFSFDEMCLIRHKSPKFRIEVFEDCTPEELAGALRKAAEYLTKRYNKI